MPIETQSPYYKVVVEKVINAEHSDPRFEVVCNSLVSALEGGATVVGTSASWDLGRDGVGLASAQGLYVLSSLRDDIDVKVLDDLERITSTTRGIKRLYFCLSNRVSEHSRAKYEAQLSGEAGGAFDIVCLGSGQLSDVAARHLGLIEQHYGAEMADVLRVMNDEPGDSAEVRGLRLALISAAGESSDSIRKEVYKTALLDVFADSKARTLARASKDLSDSLRLHRTISEQAVLPHLKDLLDEGLVSFSNQVYAMTGAGTESVKKRREAGVDRLIALRQAVRNALEAGIGSRMVDDDFARVWAVFEERMAHYFTSRGQSVVAEVCELLGTDDEAPPNAAAQAPRLSFLEELAVAVGQTSSHADRQAELEQAVKDIFSDRTGPAADWLVRIAANFMTACALGLEHSSAAALERLLARTRLVLDTDVVLSLLGEGEPEHDGINALVDRWKKIGGSVLVAEPVLEEVARHAFIAHHDFGQVRHFLPGTPEERLHLIGNAFVRSFAELMARGEAKMGNWRDYMRMFLGTAEYDWSRVLETLAGDYAVNKLPPSGLDAVDFEKDVRTFLVRQVEAENARADPFKFDKAKRDAQLYVALVSHIKKLREQDPGAACLLVSSAKRLIRVEEKFQASGESHIVATVPAVLYLLSMLPNVTLGLSAMKTFLFDDRRSNFSGEFERTVLRLVRGSAERSMPFAKRGSLMRSLRTRILRGANEQGDKANDKATLNRFEKEAFTPGNEPRTLEMISQSLDEIGVDSKAEIQIAELKRKVVELQAKLEQSRKR